tara:strand:+ start:1727 stop:2167 length:441 start_codon:yes stop_codon:yes gene_type:complete
MVIKSYVGNIPNTHIRDFQRKKLYQAEEDCLFWNNLYILSTIEVTDLIQDISKYFNIKTPIIATTGHELVYATQDLISIPYPTSKSLPYICHEMSHVINYNDPDKADHHGANFAKTYLQVVKEFIGEEDYIELEQAFDRRKVKYNV